MPYKDQGMKSLRQKERRVKPLGEVPGHIEAPLEAPWQHLRAFISEPCPGMPRLERLQRIAGSLGKNAHEVRMGDLTIEEVGKVIGAMPPLVGRGYNG